MSPMVDSWWQKIKQHWIVGLVIVVTSIVVILLIVAGYWFNWTWTGFGSETSEPKQHAKTLWDWLQLLIIPIMLVIGGFWLNRIQNSREQRIAEKRAKTERGIASDNQREAALQEYIDRMSELLLEKKLRKSKPGDEVRISV
jgi:hypothetical protein